MNSFFGGVTVEAPEFKLLDAGEQLVRLVNHEELDSFTQYSGEPKPETKEYEVPTPQLAITVVAAEPGKSGGLTHRFNGQGYVKYDELTDEQKQDEAYLNIDGYAACLHSYDEKTDTYVPDPENGTLMARIVDEKRTRDCKNILMQFCSAAQLKQDANLFDELSRIESDPEATFIVNVTVEEYNGKDQYRLSGFKKASAKIEAEKLVEE